MQDSALLKEIWWAGVNAVGGDRSVRDAISRLAVPRPDRILAVGKAAPAMARAAMDTLGRDVPTLVATKYDHALPLPEAARTIEAAHPVPDENSLIAGRALWQAVQDMGAGSHLLLLVSGGASALAEFPEDGLSLAALRAENTRLLSEGLDIHAMNARRKELSRIKGGKLLAGFGGARVTVLAISDVEGDALSVIGSGIGDAPAQHAFSFVAHIVASNAIAREAAAQAARDAGLDVIINDETLYDDVTALAPTLGQYLTEAAPGCHIFGGEPTVVLPPDPGQGGRNQALALEVAREISGLDGITVLVAGTDGTDGPTSAAGGIVTGRTWAEDAAHYLRAADSGRFLETSEALFTSGPTGTNVMDLLIAIKR
ncbi:DUF4147 domain-containing protein [Shimia biformata]|uniref:DUF4147 domain-containing protein n=1 Tax=Shimia biformata TaxID=1294299 RepID=UPI001950EE10|nr:DUF4147 domain-containing protein [Shimia biformata]